MTTARPSRRSNWSNQISRWCRTRSIASLPWSRMEVTANERMSRTLQFLISCANQSTLCKCSRAKPPMTSTSWSVLWTRSTPAKWSCCAKCRTRQNWSKSRRSASKPLCARLTKSTLPPSQLKKLSGTISSRTKTFTTNSFRSGQRKRCHSGRSPSDRFAEEP